MTRTEPTFAFGEIEGGGLAAASRACVALRPTSRTHTPSLALGVGFVYGPYGPSEKKNHLIRLLLRQIVSCGILFGFFELFSSEGLLFVEVWGILFIEASRRKTYGGFVP